MTDLSTQRNKYQEKIVVLARFYDEQERLTGAGIAGESIVQLPVHAVSLIELKLKKCGWERLEQYTEVKRLSSGDISYTAYICPSHLGYLAAFPKHIGKDDNNVNFSAGYIQTQPCA
jgi:hypothetical protein